MSNQLHPMTKIVQIGQKEHGSTHYPVPPLVMNSAVLLESVEDGWEMLTNETRDNIAYQRYSNPTVCILEKKFSIMEGAAKSLAVNSGMTAVYLLFRSLLNSGDHILSMHSLYHEISDQIIYDVKSCGIKYNLISDYSIDNFKKNIKENTKIIFIESPSNPAMNDVNIPLLAKVCKEKNILLVVDNTLLTQAYLNPLELGADISLYSTTKLLNGHGDAMGGILSTNSMELYNKMKSFRDNTGLIMDPFSAWLTIRGFRTFYLRIEKQTENAHKIVAALREKNSKYKILYTDMCKYNLENKVTGYGHIFSIVFNSKAEGFKFFTNLSLFKIGTTFGNLESLCYHFATFTRPSRDISKIGLPKGLVRLSIGIEYYEDILSDILQALEKVRE